MTKTFPLTLNDNYYCIDEGDGTRSALCVPFVQRCFGQTPEKVSVTVSTDEIPNAYKVSVTKCGYYRWHWDNSNGNWGMFGMEPFAEDTLNRFFPDAREDGLDKPHELWLQFMV